MSANAAASNVPEAGSDRELVVTRLFDASRDLVFSAWSQPDHLGKWFGPRGFTMTTKEFEFRPGGVWRFTFHGPDGTDYLNRVVFVNIDKPSRLFYKHSGEGKDEGIAFQTTVDFAAVGEKTRVTMRMAFDTAEELRRVAEEHGAIEGAYQTLDRLQEFVAPLLAEDAGEFVISRVFKAPRELMFRVWTEREHLMQWFGPKGFTMFACTSDPRPGGKMHYGLRAPNGAEMWGLWVFTAVEPPSRFSFVTSFSDANGGITRAPFGDDWPLEWSSDVEFTEQEGRTTIFMRGRAIKATEAEMRKFADSFGSMNQGWTGTFEQLGEYLAKQTGEAW